MNKKTDYVTDVPYAFSFYKEMQPLWLATIATFQGVQPPALNKPFRYCELGCGLGVSLLIAAAANPQGHFVGIDFNATHIAQAQKSARQLGLTNIEFIHTDFAAFAGSKTPAFDFIVCHGTWSWISAANKQHIVSILAKMLRSQGIFYLHYMCHPGATHMLPIQKLIHEHANLTDGDSAQKIQAVLTVIRQLVSAGAFADNPALEQHLHALAKREPNYLAHEFLTDNWQPEHSPDIHKLLADNGVSYLGSANVFDNITQLSIPGAIQPVLADISNPALREMIKDLARHQHQRQDVFQRQSIACTAAEQLQQLNAIRFKYLATTPLTTDFTFNTPIGPIHGPAELFMPVCQKLHTAPASFAALSELGMFQHQPALLLQVVQMLMWQELLHPLPQTAIPADPPQLQKLEQWILQHNFPLQLITECGSARRKPLAAPAQPRPFS